MCKNNLIGKNRSRYVSRYSPDRKVTAAQYIIELICEKKAKIEGIELPIKFWNLVEWQNFFKMQLRVCHKLLKTYHEKSIIRALMDKASDRTYSLHAPWLVPIIEKHQRIVALEISKIENANVESVNINLGKQRPPQKVRTTLSKLKELE